MGNIVLLDELTINKIAAGEVIERPASVVKELVENSIDAGANKINIETKNGGITYIRITDNGKGFLPDDMEMAFERHATSKIREAADLETVTSMGFRGEALASIAAISHVELISKTADNEIGKKVEVKGGNIINVEDAGCPVGTTITVTDLFYNTPVRYKFLKKDFTEAGYIEDVVTRIALVHPEISIKLVNSGKVILQTSGNGDMKSVIYSVYGKDVAENIIDINYEYEDIKVTGVIGKPVIARSNRSNQLFFVNKRYIKDKVLTSAAEQGYKGLLTIGKYGFLVLDIEMNPQKVDVNVHPAKLEVRFEDENKIFKAIYHSIKDSLLKEDLIPDKTKIELEKNQINNNWKINNPINNFNNSAVDIKSEENVEKTDQTPQDSKIDILAEINKFNSNTNSTIPNISEIKRIENNEPVKVGQDLSSKVNMVNNLVNSLKNELSENNYSNNINSNIEEKEVEANIENKEELYNIKNTDSSEDGTSKEDKTERRFGALFNMFGGKKKDAKIEEKVKDTENDLDDDIDDTKNFIAQIYNNKANNNENLNNETDNQATKVLDLSEINNKLRELDDLKVDQNDQDFEEMYEKTFGKKIKEESNIEEENVEYKVNDQDLKTVENVSIFDQYSKNSIPDYKYIGIAFSTYIIIEMKDELYIIDQHAAHERIMYEKIKANYYSDDKKDSQLMLLPDIINLSHKDMQIAKDNMEIFRKAGFELEEFGENTIKLTGVPTVCLDLDTKELFIETLDEINTVARTAKQEIEEKFIATIACKAAVKANMALTKEEVDNLMSQLLVLPNPFTCPHGRPTAIRMTRNDIERKFSRR